MESDNGCDTDRPQLCSRCLELFEFARPDIIKNITHLKGNFITNATSHGHPEATIKRLREDKRWYEEAVAATDTAGPPSPFEAGIVSGASQNRRFYGIQGRVYGVDVWGREDHQRTWGEIKDSAIINACRVCKTLVSMIRYQQRHASQSELNLELMEEDAIRSSWLMSTDDLAIECLRFEIWRENHLKCRVSFRASASHREALYSALAIPRGDHTGTEECMEVLVKSFRRCIDEHNTCSPLIWMPTRLLDLMPESEPGVVKLVTRDDVTEETSSKTWEQCRYFTLSHQWGTHTPLSLTGDTLRAMQQGIRVEEIPQCYRDAMNITRSCGIRYLWIDSLCIIQDSLEDWETEAAFMDMVYGHGSCNIIASEAEDSTHSLFSERDPTEGVAIVHTQQFRDQSITFTLEPDWTDIAASFARLYSRGWVVQERFLSPRLMHMSRFPTWQCNEGAACESSPDGWVSIKGRDYDTAVYQRDRLNPRFLYTQPRTRDQIMECWLRIVEEYSSCALTHTDMDKLIAVGGLANAFRGRLDVEYYAGIWGMEHALETLCWVRAWDMVKPRHPAPVEYRAPSWSWASIDEEVSYSFTRNYFTVKSFPGRQESMRPLAQIISVQTQTKTENSFGQITGGQLVIRGHLFPTLDFDEGSIDMGNPRHYQCVLDYESDPSERDDASVLFLPLAATGRDNELHGSTKMRYMSVFGLYLRTTYREVTELGGPQFKRIAAGHLVCRFFTDDKTRKNMLADDVWEKIVALDSSADEGRSGETILVI